MSQRVLSSCPHTSLCRQNCRKCGIFVSRQQPHDPPLKSRIFDSFINSSSSLYLKHIRKRQSTQRKNHNEITDTTALLIDAICEKFEYSIETRALGTYIYAEACQQQESDQGFWMAVCLMVASKGIELDRRVPYLNRFQRYADKNFSQEDYELGEKTIFRQMDFNIQFSTFISFVNLYLTMGVCFQSDLQDCQNSDLPRTLEDEICLKSKAMVRHGAFLTYQPEQLALSLIKDARIKLNLQPWKLQLQELTDYRQEEILNIGFQTPHINSLSSVRGSPNQESSNNKLTVPPLRPILLPLNESTNSSAGNKIPNELIANNLGDVSAAKNIFIAPALKKNYHQKENSFNGVRCHKKKLGSIQINTLSNSLHLRMPSQAASFKHVALPLLQTKSLIFAPAKKRCEKNANIRAIKQ